MNNEFSTKYYYWNFSYTWLILTFNIFYWFQRLRKDLDNQYPPFKSLYIPYTYPFSWFHLSIFLVFSIILILNFSLFSLIVIFSYPHRPAFISLGSVMPASLLNCWHSSVEFQVRQWCFYWIWQNQKSMGYTYGRKPYNL